MKIEGRVRRSGAFVQSLSEPLRESRCGDSKSHSTILPDLVGHCFYSDFCAGWLRSFRLEGGEAVDEADWPVGDLGLSFPSAGPGPGRDHPWGTDRGQPLYPGMKMAEIGFHGVSPSPFTFLPRRWP
jgi:hypothetical protein